MLLEMKAVGRGHRPAQPVEPRVVPGHDPRGPDHATRSLTKISEKTLIPVEELNAALADPAAIGLPAEANGNAEGWLFPATYDVEPGRDRRRAC